MDIMMNFKMKDINKILDGEKKCEYRGFLFDGDINKVYLYNKEKNKICGIMVINEVISDLPLKVWNKTYTLKNNGINTKEFLRNYNNYDRVSALCISNALKIDVDCSTIDGFKAPKTYIKL